MNKDVIATIPSATPTLDDLQRTIASFDVTELSRLCSDMEKKYCQLVVFNGKKKKEALKLAGSNAKPEYLSKMAYEMEQRPHVRAYMDELRNVRSAESQVELQEVILATRKAIDLCLEDPRTAAKAEPLLRLLAELGGFAKAAPTTAVQINNAPSMQSPAGSSIDADLERLQRITGGS